MFDFEWLCLTYDALFRFLIMCFDPFTHRPTIALDGCLITDMCLGLSTVPLWHVQRDVETTNNLNRKCFIKFPKEKKIQHFTIIYLVNMFSNVRIKWKLLKLHITCILFLFFKRQQARKLRFYMELHRPSMGPLVLND
jgi:hypothetical protein